MLELIQQKNCLVGSLDAISQLAVKENARILTISDSHGDFQTVKSIVLNYGEHCDLLAFCGDGASDIVQLLISAHNDEELQKKLPPVLAFVQGNCDPYELDAAISIGADQNSTILQFPPRQLLTVNGQNLLIVHGHEQGIGWTYNKLGLELQYSQAKLALYGHTHIAHEHLEETYKFVNPGSCSRPRGGQPDGFAIITVGKTFTDTAFIKINRDGTFSSYHPIY
ncbi:MAG: YfcE family phosphodiesterase [Treponema sp.]|nr:YfcE family phosphodiesterase [Treponema sp.]